MPVPMPEHRSRCSPQRGGRAVATDIGGQFCRVDVTSEDSVPMGAESREALAKNGFLFTAR